MNKQHIISKIFILGILLSFAPILLSAQTKAKFGHLDFGTVMQSMSGIDTAQAIILQLKSDLETEAAKMNEEFEKEYTDFTQKQNTYSPAVLKIKQEELQKMYSRLQEFTESAQSILQNKQIELLAPFKTILTNAISEVAKEHNYTYIFDVTTLSYYAETDDITAMVKAKLGIQ